MQNFELTYYRQQVTGDKKVRKLGAWDTVPPKKCQFPPPPTVVSFSKKCPT